MATKVVRLRPRSAEPKGLSKRELRREQRRWRLVVRTALKLISIPDTATLRDVVALFDAAIDEAKIGRQLVALVDRAKPVKRAPR